MRVWLILLEVGEDNGVHDTYTGTFDVNSSSSSRPNSKLPVSREDPIEIPIGPMTRARAKKLKDAMVGLIQQVWVKCEKFNPYWAFDKAQSRCNVLHVDF
ncbi:hypothetical protein PVK06_026845 [Gossypium arboreum]|uniref:Uncharacterized protein n=1 Tax=Gossypium arboreum TaxID=29729 RepID=A0ABR0NZ97_GOSAR|nr:hypothetical protein PVK06_026845 [Gossypium arboreum]